MPGPLEERLLSLGWKSAWFDASDAQIEEFTHGFLRRLAVDYLRGNSVLAKAYQAGFHNATAWQAELTTQAQAGQWADEAHFMALASLIGFHSKAYKTVYDGGSSRIEPLSPLLNHTCTDGHGTIDTKKPTLHLVNNGGHWYRKDYPPQSTQGAGNCLYNACGQELQRLVKAERQLINQSTSDVVNPGIEPSVLMTHPTTTIVPENRHSPSTIVHDFENTGSHRLPTAAPRLARDVLDSATALHIEYNRLERQLGTEGQQELNASYATLQVFTPCKTQEAASSNTAGSLTQERRDHLLALRLQLEEIKRYHQSCAQ